MYAEATKMLQGEIDQNIKYVNGLLLKIQWNKLSETAAY